MIVYLTLRRFNGCPDPDGVLCLFPFTLLIRWPVRLLSFFRAALIRGLDVAKRSYGLRTCRLKTEMSRFMSCSVSSSSARHANRFEDELVELCLG